MDTLVEDDGVVAAGKRAEQRVIGEKAAAEIERALATEEARRESLQRRVRLMMFTLLAYLIMRYGIRLGGFDPKKYVAELVDEQLSIDAIHRLYRGMPAAGSLFMGMAAEVIGLEATVATAAAKCSL